MKKINKITTTSALAFLLVLGFVSPNSAYAATTPSLGATSTYAIVSSTYTNSLNAGLETAIVGDVCYTTPPSTAPISITGAVAVPCGGTRGTDQGSALTDINGQACTNLGANVVLSGTYTPGCYYSTGTMDITLGTTVTLDGSGSYIFRSGGALTTGANSTVALSGGASACNVFWAPVGNTTLGANASTSVTPTFVGTIIADANGSAGITVGHFANVLGRLLAYGHTVTTDSNTITAPTCAASAPTLNIIKHVNNDNGGSKVASNWTLTLSSSNAGTGTGSAAGSESGTIYTLEAGKDYTVSENNDGSTYRESSTSECTITNATTNTIYTCTITNDDIAQQSNQSSGGRNPYTTYQPYVTTTTLVTTPVVITTVPKLPNTGFADEKKNNISLIVAGIFASSIIFYSIRRKIIA